MKVSAISTVSSHMVDFFIMLKSGQMLFYYPFGNFNNCTAG